MNINTTPIPSASTVPTAVSIAPAYGANNQDLFGYLSSLGVNAPGLINQVMNFGTNPSSMDSGVLNQMNGYEPTVGGEMGSVNQIVQNAMGYEPNYSSEQYTNPAAWDQQHGGGPLTLAGILSGAGTGNMAQVLGAENGLMQPLDPILKALGVSLGSNAMAGSGGAVGIGPQEQPPTSGSGLGLGGLPTPTSVFGQQAIAQILPYILQYMATPEQDLLNSDANLSNLSAGNAFNLPILASQQAQQNEQQAYSLGQMALGAQLSGQGAVANAAYGLGQMGLGDLASLAQTIMGAAVTPNQTTIMPAQPNPYAGQGLPGFNPNFGQQQQGGQQQGGGGGGGQGQPGGGTPSTAPPSSYWGGDTGPPVYYGDGTPPPGWVSGTSPLPAAGNGYNTNVYNAINSTFPGPSAGSGAPSGYTGYGAIMPIGGGGTSGPSSMGASGGAGPF